MEKTKNNKPKRLSLYPLEFEEAIADVLKVKPQQREKEQKKQNPKKKTGRHKD